MDVGRFHIPRHCGVLVCTPHSSGFVRAMLGLPPLWGGFPVSEALHLGIIRQPPFNRVVGQPIGNCLITGFVGGARNLAQTLINPT